tara:strand:- start:244 stop:597 length:354 start_codon:yes stop_codon:yes gene_type:complete
VEERKKLAVVSLLTSLPAPILLGILLASIRINVQSPEFDFQSYAFSTIGLFLLLIFVAPVATVMSLLTGYVAFMQSRQWAKKVAVVSFLCTLTAVILLIILVVTMNGFEAAPPSFNS